MSIFKVDSLAKVFIHIGIIIVLFVGLLLFFFFMYLPNATHHNETITVPKIVGMNSEDLKNFLESKQLRFKINDSSYTPGVVANTILTQHPLPETKVKENRMIYITVAAKNPPKVEMPDLLKDQVSLKGAQIKLSQLGLTADIITVPGKQDVVYDQLIKGRRVQPGTMIDKGTKITLKVGNSGGPVTVPDLAGFDIESAKMKAQELGLILEVQSQGASPMDIIKRQKPAADEETSAGETIDVWTTE